MNGPGFHGNRSLTLCRRFVLRTLGVLACALMIPALAHAQSEISGTIKDASGAVLPGVTVEIASPVLIEKTRNTVTDGAGQYRLVQVPSGTYSVTFTLPGFTVVK